MLMEPDSVPVIADSAPTSEWQTDSGHHAACCVAKPGRTRDVWLGVVGSAVQFHRDDQGCFRPRRCVKRVRWPFACSQSGAKRSEQRLVASRNQVLHCDGKIRGRLSTARPLVWELTGITSDPRGEAWTVRFYKAPDTIPNQPGLVILHLRCDCDQKTDIGWGDMLVPQPQAMTGQSTDQQKGHD